MFRWLAIFIATAVLPMVSGCGGVVTSFVVEKGNKYCDRKPGAVNTAKDDLNKALAQNGARFSVDGITCHKSKPG